MAGGALVNAMLQFLPLLNLLLLPAIASVWKLSDRLARLETTQTEHARRISVNERFQERTAHHQESAT